MSCDPPKTVALDMFEFQSLIFEIFISTINSAMNYIISHICVHSNHFDFQFNCFGSDKLVL